MAVSAFRVTQLPLLRQSQVELKFPYLAKRHYSPLNLDFTFISQFPVARSKKMIGCRNLKGFVISAQYSQSQDLFTSRLQSIFQILLLLSLVRAFLLLIKGVILIAGRIENLPKLVEDIVQTSINTGPRGALRLVQGVQAFLGVGGEWLNDLF